MFVDVSLLKRALDKQRKRLENVFLKIADCSDVAKTGSYNDLTDTPNYEAKADKANIIAGVIGTKEATEGLTFEVPWIEVNGQGVIVAYGTHTHTVPD